MTYTTTITGLTAGQSYTFAVSAVNDAGEGPKSAAVTQATNAGGSVPGAPSSLHTTGAADQHTVPLAWTVGTADATNPTQGFRIFGSIGGGAATQLAQVAGATTNSYTLTGLTPSTTYALTVRAYNVAGMSAASNSINVTTTDVVVSGVFKFRSGGWYEKPLPNNAPAHPNSDAMLAWLVKTGTGLQGSPAIGLNGALGTSTSSTFTSTNYIAAASDPLYHFPSTANCPTYFKTGNPGIRIPVEAQRYYPLSSTANDSPFQVYVPPAADPGGRGFYAWFAMCQWNGSTWVLTGTGASGSVMFTDSYGHAKGSLPNWPDTLLGSGRTPQFYQDEPLNDCARGINPMIRCVSYPRVKAEGIVNYVTEIFMGNETAGSGRWPLTGFEGRHTSGNIPEGTRFRILPGVDVEALLATDTAYYGTAGNRTATQAAAYQEACAIGLGWQKYGAIVADNGGNGGNVIKVDATWKKGSGVQLWKVPKDGMRKLPLAPTAGIWQAVQDNYDPA